MGASPPVGPIWCEEAEHVVLGTVLSHRHGMESVVEVLRPEHFCDPLNQRVFTACIKLFEGGGVVNVISIKRQMERDTELESVGGTKFLAHLVANASSLTIARDYAEIVRDYFVRRVLQEIGMSLSADAQAMPEGLDGEGLLRRTEDTLFQVGEVGKPDGGPVDFTTALRAAITSIDTIQSSGGKPMGVMSGIVDLDRRVGGFIGGGLYIVAGRPGMGKTDLGLNIATNVAATGKPVVYFNLEMSAGELAHRVIARYSRVPVRDQRRALPPHTPQESEAIYEAAAAINSLPLHIDDTGGISLAKLRVRARRHKRRHGLALIVVDYIGLMTPPDAKANKVHQIEAITSGLKALAKELNIPVIALAQLSRQVEQREDKRPMLSDLRDSGAIEQDADVVMFTYREEYYLSREEPAQRTGEKEGDYRTRWTDWQEAVARSAGIAEVIVGKHRQGEVGTVTMHYTGAHHTFSDLYRGGK
jgi:replicative DNA helicase